MKRILFSLFIAALLAVVLNFGAWLMYNRLVVQGLEEAKIKANINGMEFTYDKIVFDSFKSWDMDGALLKVKVGLVNKGEISAERVDFQFKPLQGLLNFSTGYPITFKGAFAFASVNNILSFAAGEKFTLDLEFKNHFLSPFTSRDNYLSFSEIAFHLGKGQTLNATNKEVIGNTNGLDVVSTFAKTEDDLNHLLFSFGTVNTHSNGNLNLPPEILKFSNLFDGVRLKIDLSYAFKRSDINKPLRVFIKELFFGNDTANISLNGDAVSGSKHDYLDMHFAFANYLELIDAFRSIYNYTLQEQKKANPFMIFTEIDEVQVSAFKDTLKQFTDENKILKINLTSNNQEETKISGKPVSEIMAQMQNDIIAKKTAKDAAATEPKKKAK